MAISTQEFCVWDESGDDCTGDIGNPLFTIHNGRLFVVGLRSYVESDDVRDIIDFHENFFSTFVAFPYRTSLNRVNIQACMSKLGQC